MYGMKCSSAERNSSYFGKINTKRKNKQKEETKAREILKKKKTLKSDKKYGKKLVITKWKDESQR